MALIETKPEIERGSIVPNGVAIELYRKMLLAAYTEQRLTILDRQGKVSFYASTRGHEKLQVGMTMLLKPGHDWFFTYYRDKGIPNWAGYAVEGSFSWDAEPAG